jgi:hypothetical protein
MKALGFYLSHEGRLVFLEFKEYGPGDTTRDLAKADFTDIPILGKNDFLIVYGELPKGPMDSPVNVLQYDESGSALTFGGEQRSFEFIFTAVPEPSVNSQKVTKFLPKASLSNGLYVIHYYVGTLNDAYFPLRVER